MFSARIGCCFAETLCVHHSDEYLRDVNKAERHRVKMKHYRKRLRNYRLNESEGSFNGFRESGKPCSCMFCDPHKFNPKGKHSTNVRLSKCLVE